MIPGFRLPETAGRAYGMEARSFAPFGGQDGKRVESHFAGAEEAEWPVPEGKDFSGSTEFFAVAFLFYSGEQFVVTEAEKVQPWMPPTECLEPLGGQHSGGFRTRTWRDGSSFPHQLLAQRQGLARGLAIEVGPREPR